MVPSPSTHASPTACRKAARIDPCRFLQDFRLWGRNMTNYILNHSVGRNICLLYDGPSGITSRTLHVFFVNDTILRGVENGHPKTFRRDRILSAGFLPDRFDVQPPSAAQPPSARSTNPHQDPPSHARQN